MYVCVSKWRMDAGACGGQESLLVPLSRGYRKNCERLDVAAGNLIHILRKTSVHRKPSLQPTVMVFKAACLGGSLCYCTRFKFFFMCLFARHRGWREIIPRCCQLVMVIDWSQKNTLAWLLLSLELCLSDWRKIKLLTEMGKEEGTAIGRSPGLVCGVCWASSCWAVMRVFFLPFSHRLHPFHSLFLWMTSGTSLCWVAPLNECS